MDVNKLEVEKIAQENKVEILIHGHVHRPKVHDEAFGQRIVLGDWDNILSFLIPWSRLVSNSSLFHFLEE